LDLPPNVDDFHVRLNAQKFCTHTVCTYMQYDGKLYDVSYLKRVKVVVKLTRSGFNKQKEYHNRQRRVVVAPEQTLICLQCGNDNLRKRQKVQTT